MINQHYFSEFVLRNGDNFYMADFSPDAGLSSPPHTHMDFYEFFIVLEGEFSDLTNSKTVLLRKNQVHILFPNDIHAVKASGKFEKNILRNIAVKKDYFENRLSFSGHTSDKLKKYFLLSSNAFSSLTERTAASISLFSTPEAYNFTLSGILDEIMFYSIFVSSNTDDMPKWLQNLLVQMEKEDNFTAGLSRMIVISGKTQEYLNRAFKKYCRTTPTEYINSLRLRHAARLLQTENTKIIDIIYRCGFSSISYFNKIFKEFFCVTPREYREKNIF